MAPVVEDLEKPEQCLEPQQQELSSSSGSDEEGNGVANAAKSDGFPDGGARAWVTAVASAGVLFCTMGFVNAFGVLQEYYHTNQLASSSASDISWIGSLQFFFLFASTLIGGPLFDRYGSIVLWPGVLTYVLSIMLTSLCTQYYQFILAQGIMGGIGIGMTMCPAMAATGQYFHKKRALSMGIIIAGSSIGGVIFPIMLGKMLPNPRLGLGWAMRISGFIVLAVLVPSCLAIKARLPPRRGRIFLLEAFKQPDFSTMIAATFLSLMAVFVPLFYLPAFAVHNGMNPQLASYLVAIHNGASLFGRVLPGMAADRYGRLNVFFGAAASSGLLAFCWQRATSNAAIIAFAAIYGFASGAIVSMTAACLTLAARRPQDIGTYLGMALAACSVAPLVGPPASGAILARAGYGSVADFSGAVLLAGAVMVVVAKWTTGKGLLSLA